MSLYCTLCSAKHCCQCCRSYQEPFVFVAIICLCFVGYETFENMLASVLTGGVHWKKAAICAGSSQCRRLPTAVECEADASAGGGASQSGQQPDCSLCGPVSDPLSGVRLSWLHLHIHHCCLEGQQEQQAGEQASFMVLAQKSCCNLDSCHLCADFA